MSPTQPSAFALVILSLAAGCSASPASTPGAGGTSGGTAGAGGTAATAGTGATGGGTGGVGGGATCPGPGYVTAPTTRTFTSVTATVQDLSGAPVTKALAQVCGTDLCINGGPADAQGKVFVDMSGQTLMNPHFKYGNGLLHVKFIMGLPEQAVVDLGIVKTAALPDVTTGAPMAPGGTATSGGVSLTVPSSASITTDPFLPEGADGFRAVVIPKEQAPVAVDATKAFEIIVGTAPLETKFCPPAALSVPNSAGWPAGTAVEFWIEGLDITEEWAPYGGWQKTSDGAVSADGATVATDPAGGIAWLSSVVAIRKK